MKNSDILSNILLDGIQEEDSNPVDIKLILFKYLKYWWLFAMGLVVFISLAVVYLFYATPQYSITSTLLIKVDQGIDFTKNAVFSDLEAYESSSKVENEMEILGSYSLMRNAINQLPFHAFFFVEDKYSRVREIYGSQVPVEVVIHEINTSGAELPEDRSIKVHLANEGFSMQLSEDKQQNFKYGEKIKNWYGTFSIEKKEGFSEASPKDLIISLNNKDQLANRYSSSLQISLSNKYASVVNLSLVDAIPQRGEDILNKLVEVYNLQAVKQKNITATNTIDFIDEQLNTLTRELEEVEQKIEAYKRTNNISDLSSEMAFHVGSSGEYESQLSRNNTQIEVLESIESHLISNSAGLGAQVTSSLTIEDKTLAGLVVRYNEMQSEKARMLRTTEPNNPLVINLEEQLSSLKRNILSNLGEIKNGLLIQNRNLQSMVAQLDTRVREVPEIERGLLELTREQGTKQEHYLYLVKKREESKLSLAATTVSNSRIIDVASGGGAPVKPNKKAILGFAFLLGMGIPFGFIYLKNTLSSKIIQKHDITKITSIPILAEISHNKNKEILAISERRKTPIAEQFRLLRTNLRFINNDMDDKVVLVTSSISGEGKTFFSINFGVSLSLTGKKVVILEFDLRKPALLNSLFMKKSVGITEYLTSDHIKVDDLIKAYDPVANLSIIGCGSIPDDPAELMLSPKVKQLISELKEKFDYIILDTAPVGTVADAFNLVPYIDYSLFLVRYNYTQKNHIQFMEEINMKNKLKRPLLILNDANVSGMNYGYGYGYGYEEKKNVYS